LSTKRSGQGLVGQTYMKWVKRMECVILGVRCSATCH